MYYFPIVELIERLLKWLKEEGGVVYWVWITSVGILFAFFLIVWATSSFDEARPLLAFFILTWIGGAYPVWLVEKRRKGSQQKPRIVGDKKSVG